MFKPDLHRLAVFCAVVDEGSLSRASKRLYMSQPAISAHIKSLEQQLGLALFHRVGRRSVVSKAGEVLYHKSGELFVIADELRTVMANLKGVDYGRLHVGMSLEWEHVLPRMLGQYKNAYPGVEMLLTVHQCSEVEKLVLDRSIDVGFISRPSERDELDSDCTVVEELVLISARNHRLARIDIINSEELKEEMLFVREDGSTTRQETDRILQEYGLTKCIAMEAASYQAIKASVLEGAGVGIVPLSALDQNEKLNKFSVLNVPDMRGVLELNRIYLKGRKMTAVQENFMQMVQPSTAWISGNSITSESLAFASD
jgi:DNA-binding transcriptional LysR family regulator